jgi:hypothetical protein
MRSVGKNKIAIAILFLVVLIGALYALKHPAGQGKVLEYKGGRLFYTSKVTEEETRRLGDYLSRVGLFQNNEGPVIAQLTKKKDTYQLRVVTDLEEIEKERPAEKMGPVEAAGLLAEDISTEVFDGAKVEWHLCDDKLKTVRIGGY